MINAHPRIAMVPEIPWLASRYSLREGMTTDGTLTPAFFALLRNFGRFSPVPFEAGKLAELAETDTPISYADFMTSLFDAYGGKNGKDLVGQKNADHGAPMDIATLHALWPGAKFVHLIRNGRDVCLSVLNWRVHEKMGRLFSTWNDHRVSTIAAWWEWQVRLTREAGRAIGAAQYRELRYEELVAHPEETLTGLCEFVDVPYDDAMLRFHESPPSRQAKQSWTPPAPGRRIWRPEMSPEDRERFAAVAGGLLQELGYPLGAKAVSERTSITAAFVRATFELRPLPQQWLETSAPPEEPRASE